MAPRMVADCVALAILAPNDARIRLDRLTDDEERRVHAFAAQDVQNLVGVRRIRTVVVGEGDDALVLRSADHRFPEELTAGAFRHLVDAEDQRSGRGHKDGSACRAREFHGDADCRAQRLVRARASAAATFCRNSSGPNARKSSTTFW